MPSWHLLLCMSGLGASGYRSQWYAWRDGASEPVAVTPFGVPMPFQETERPGTHLCCTASAYVWLWVAPGRPYRFNELPQ